MGRRSLLSICLILGFLACTTLSADKTPNRWTDAEIKLTLGEYLQLYFSVNMSSTVPRDGGVSIDFYPSDNPENAILVITRIWSPGEVLTNDNDWQKALIGIDKMIVTRFEHQLKELASTKRWSVGDPAAHLVIRDVSAKDGGKSIAVMLNGKTYFDQASFERAAAFVLDHGGSGFARREAAMKIVCGYFRAGVIAELEALEDFLKLMEQQIDETHQEEEKRVAAEFEGPSGNDNEHSDQERFAAENARLRECAIRHARYQRILRYSFIVLLYALIESNLTRIADEIVTRKKLALKFEDLKARDLIEQLQKFWTKIAKLHWWKDDRWSVVMDVQELRNCIAHRHGRTRKADDRIYSLTKKSESGIRLLALNDPDYCDPDDVGMVVIDGDFCRKAIADIQGLFTAIFDNAECFGSEKVIIEP